MNTTSNICAAQFIRLRLRLMLLAISSATFSGCASDPYAPPPLWNYYPYDFGMVNLTKVQVSEVNLYMLKPGGEEVLIAFGCNRVCRDDEPLHWGARSATAQRPARVPDTVIMRWRTSNAKDHFQVMSLKQAVSDQVGFDGTVWFRFLGDHWKQSSFTKAQTNWRVTHNLSAAPSETDP